MHMDLQIHCFFILLMVLCRFQLLKKATMREKLQIMEIKFGDQCRYKEKTMFYQRHDILFKVAALCGLYEDLHVNAERMTDHILAIKNFDIRLAKGVMSLVDDIAKYSDKSYFAVYFARMYCGYHRPDLYPMADRYIEYAMMNYAWLMKMPQPYYSELKRYGVFKKFFQALMRHCELEHIPQEDILNFFYFVGKRKLDKEWRQNISKTKENFSVNEHVLSIVKRTE